MKHPIPHERLAHMTGVAEYMYENAGKYKGLDPDKMYLTGLLHDIGYIAGENENHEAYGAKLIFDSFSTNFKMPGKGLVILHHRETPKEYLKNHNKVPDDLRLLWEAEMSVDLSGENIGYERKLSEIEKQYGKGSEPYRICSETIRWLMESKHE